MSGVVNKVTGFVGDVVGGITGATAAGEAAQQGAATTAAAQREALDYLREREAIPQQFREDALGQLGGLYGLEGGDPEALANLERTPMYQAVMGGQQAGEEAILRHAGATGGLRSGDASYNLADYNAQLQNQALLQGLSGIQGMAQLPSMAPQIASGIAGVGQTIGQGQVAAGQAQQAGAGMLLSGLAQGAGAYFSDARLKINVEPKGKRNGHEWFSWVWNSRAKELGLEGKGEGVIADKVEKYLPEAIKVHKGFKTVDYDMLGV